MTTNPAELAAADADAFRAEGPRIDNRIGTLVNLVIGAVAASGGIGGVAGLISRQHHAYVATTLLGVSAVVLMAGFLLIGRLILPRITPSPTSQSWSLAWVADLPDADAARDYYETAADDLDTHLCLQAWSHAVSIRRRFRRFRTAGRVLAVGAVLALVGFLALAWGW
jgi:hypothetical protein